MPTISPKSVMRYACLSVCLLFVVSGLIIGAADLATAAASSPTVVSPGDTDGDGSVEVRSTNSGDGASTVRVTVSIGIAGNDATFLFDRDGDFSTTGDQGVNGSTSAVTVTDGGTGDLDGSADGSITTDLVVDGGSVTFQEGDTFTLGITEGTSVGVSPDTTVTRLTIDNTDPSITAIETRDNGQAPGTVIAGTNGSTPTANNGRIDQLVVTLSETVDDTTVSTADFAVTGYTIDSITDGGTANNNTIVIDLQESATADTGVTPQVDYTEGTLADEADNRLPSTTVSNPTDDAGPRIRSAQTGDANRDGTVDRVNITFTESVADTSLATSDFTVDGVAPDSLGSAGGGNDAVVNLTVSNLATDDTSLTPTLTATGGSIADVPGNAGPEGGDQTGIVADGAAPTILAANTYDSTYDGNVDQFNVTLSEPVADTPSTLDGTTFSLGTGSADNADTGGTADDNAVQISASGLSGTGVTPDVVLDANKIEDAAGNALPESQTFTGTTDGASPRVRGAQTGDATGDGTVDRVNITFTEGVDDASVATSDFAVDGVAPDSLGSAGGSNDAVVNLTVSNLAPDDTSLTPSLTVSSKSVDDPAGNGGPLGGDRTLTVTDGAAPAVTGANTYDSARDGSVDQLNVTLSEPVADTPSTIDSTTFTLGTGSADSADTGGTADDNTVRITASGLTGTSVTPDVILNANKIQDAGGNTLPKSQTFGATADGAAPVIVAATTKDADGDGNTDRIEVKHSEALDDAASTLDTSTYTLGSGTVDGVATGTADDTNTTISVSGLTGTSATPDVTLRAGKVFDPPGNAVPAAQTFTGTTNGANPVVTAVTTLDRDGDGNVDAASVTASAPIDDSTVTPSDWTIGGTAAEAVDTGASVDDDTIRLRITTDANEVSGTGPKEVTYTPGTTQNTNGNSLSQLDAADVSETDGAAPVITQFAASMGDNRIRVTVNSTEQLDSIHVDVVGRTTLSSFSASGSDPVTHALSYTPPVSGDYTLTVQTAADAAGNTAMTGQTTEVQVPSDSGGDGPAAPGSPSTRVASSRAIVLPGSDGTRLALSGQTMSQVEVQAANPTTGYIRVTELVELPSGTASLTDQVGNAVDIQVPDGMQRSPATIRLSVRASQVDVDPTRLRIAHYEAAAGSWTTLETSVVSRTESTITLEAETSGFSLFALTVAAESTTDTATTEPRTPTPTPTTSEPPEETAATTMEPDAPADGEGGAATQTATRTPPPPTESSGSGFDVLAATLATLSLAVLFRRRME